MLLSLPATPAQLQCRDFDGNTAWDCAMHAGDAKLADAVAAAVAAAERSGAGASGSGNGGGSRGSGA